MPPELIAKIVIEKTAFSFDKLYSYAIPHRLHSVCKPGCRVVVPFGRGNAPRQGLIMSVEEGKCDNLKEIINVSDDSPIINDEMLKLCEWFHDRLFCTYFDAVNTVLPTGITLKMVDFYSAVEGDLSKLLDQEKPIYEFLMLAGGNVKSDKIIKKFGNEAAFILASLTEKGLALKSSDAVQKMKDATEKSVRLIADDEDLLGIKLTPRQLEVVGLMQSFGTVSVKELQYFTGVSVAVIDALIKKGVLEEFQNPVYRTPEYISSAGTTEIKLTEEQNNAFKTLSSKLEIGGSALLYGVTGSGKTQVFLKLADKVVAENKGVIIMVPEISLTPQTISIFNNRYCGKIAVFHSAMSLGQRMDEWKRIRDGKALIAIGTRSAIFAPFKEIGLIIMDEEQEHTYKSEQSPRYHARDVAKFRAAYHKSLFLMASATPSVETYSGALSGKYTLCTLKNRYGNAVLPKVQTIDMREEIKSGNSGALSGELYNEISNALESGKQAIVLLNRRGHNTYISCPACGYVASCPNCSVSLTYHSANRRLMCHYCGHSVPVSDKCPECGDNHMRFSGVGTQRADEEIKMLFPEAKVLRLDADSTMQRNSFAEYLAEFSNGKYDIMLGTQMVAKGLDFPNVTVVGVIGADKSSAGADYRSAERTFSLLTQVIGRAGRGDNAGVAIIQTTEPENNIINLAERQDYDAFYNDEILLRKIMVYPPYCDIISLLFQSSSAADSLNAANAVLENIKTLVNGEFQDVKIIALGPAPANMPRVNKKFRYTLMIKCKNNKRTRSLIRAATNINLKKDASITIDVNPETFF